MPIYIIIRDNINDEILYDSTIIDEYNKNNKNQTQIEFDEIFARDMNEKIKQEESDRIFSQKIQDECDKTIENRTYKKENQNIINHYIRNMNFTINS